MSNKNKENLDKKLKKAITGENIVNSLDSSGVSEYMEYLRSPWRIFWSNLWAGMSKGFGII
jgi:hypothetical protein